MYILSLDFGHIVAAANFYDKMSIKYNLLNEIVRTKHDLLQIMWSKMKNQIDIYSTNKNYKLPSDNIIEFAASQYDDSRFQLGKHEWPALLRLLDKNKSIYK